MDLLTAYFRGEHTEDKRCPGSGELSDRPTFRISNVLSGRKRRVKQAPQRLVQVDVLHHRSEPGCEVIVAGGMRR